MVLNFQIAVLEPYSFLVSVRMNNTSDSMSEDQKFSLT